MLLLATPGSNKQINQLVGQLEDCGVRITEAQVIGHISFDTCHFSFLKFSEMTK
jgi:hypothetical protein